MRITVNEARWYLEHPSQQKWSMAAPDELPESGVEYYARDGVCGMFHPGMWPSVWMAHVAVSPLAWGKTVSPAKALLREFARDHGPELVIAWMDETNRAVLAFARRIGFTQYGRMGCGVICMEWRP